MVLLCVCMYNMDDICRYVYDDVCMLIVCIYHVAEPTMFYRIVYIYNYNQQSMIWFICLDKL